MKPCSRCAGAKTLGALVRRATGCTVEAVPCDWCKGTGIDPEHPVAWGVDGDTLRRLRREADLSMREAAHAWGVKGHRAFGRRDRPTRSRTVPRAHCGEVEVKHTPGTLRVNARTIAAEALEAAQTVALISDSPGPATLIMAGALRAIAEGRPFAAPLVFGDPREASR